MDEIIGLIAVVMSLGMPPFIVWTVAHYRYKMRSKGQLTEEELASLERMSKVADILDQRVNVLERILDDEIPDWRDNHDKTI